MKPTKTHNGIFISFYCFFLSLLISSTFAQTKLRPKAVLLQVTKDPKTLQYITQIKQRTPLVDLTLTVDLGGRFLWTDCDTSPYISSMYKFYDCNTSQCKHTGERLSCGTCSFPARPGCHNVNNSCANWSENPFARQIVSGELAVDFVSIQSTDGKNPTQVVSVPEFFFFCVKNESGMLGDLAKGVKGIAGLGQTQISLASQFASFFNFRKIFALCLSPSSKGVIIFGDGPYQFLPNVNIASILTYTPLIINNGEYFYEPLSDYFIGVKGIKINGKVVPIDTTLLPIDKNGEGGTRISTVNPYTLLESSIYAAFVKAFVNEMSNATRVAPVAPFEVCYMSKGIGSSRVGPVVPVIDLVLQSEDVYWRIFGANSMVQVNKDVSCLGFLEASFAIPVHAIRIGGYQLENNLLQFNVAKSMLGFSNSLLTHQTTCGNFNFTSVP